jgi:hypothetical protein
VTGSKTVFLDVGARLVTLGVLGPNTFDERGLLGVAFHPDYQANGRLYTYTSEPNAGTPTFPTTLPPGSTADHQNVIAEWTAVSPGDPALPTRQAAASSREVHDDEASTRIVVGRPAGGRAVRPWAGRLPRHPSERSPDRSPPHRGTPPWELARGRADLPQEQRAPLQVLRQQLAAGSPGVGRRDDEQEFVRQPGRQTFLPGGQPVAPDS